MFEKILVPLDGSKRAEQILAECGPILRCPGTRIVVLRVADPPLSPSVGMPSEQLRSLQEAESYLERMEAHLRKHGLEPTCVIREGNTAEHILAVAREENVTLILLSTHGRTGPSRWLLGSVTEKVLRGSDVPVLAYRTFPEREVFDVLEGMEVKNILLPVEESGASLETVPYVARLAQAFCAGVRVLHVVDREQARAPARRHVEEAVRKLQEAGVRAEAVERRGEPAKEILAASRELGSDLIAMTTHGRAGADRWVFGSVAEKVLRGAETPVFVVRPKGASGEAMAEPKGAARTA